MITFSKRDNTAMKTRRYGIDVTWTVVLSGLKLDGTNNLILEAHIRRFSHIYNHNNLWNQVSCQFI